MYLPSEVRLSWLASVMTASTFRSDGRAMLQSPRAALSFAAGRERQRLMLDAA